MDKQALDKYLTTEPDNGYQNTLEKIWDKIPETEISADDYEKYERFFDDLALKLSTAGTSDSGFPTIDFCSEVFISRFRKLKKHIANIKYNLVLESDMIKILELLNTNGYKPLLIGGCVRDAYLGIKPKDIDVEVYGISYEKLQQFLSSYGRVDIVGKAFGVIVFTHFGSKMRYDFSIPRKENKLGVGHTSFNITLDSNLSIKEASSRRDVTFNALAYDPITNELHDYYGGIGDLENGIIRHTSEQFKEDSLRIWRCCQFQARFDFKIHPDTIAIMKKMLTDNPDDFKMLSVERVHEEFMKWSEKGTHHDLIFKFMRDTGLINFYPELKALKETPQDELWHGEGDVEIHSQMCVTEIDRIISENNITGIDKIILVLATLTHDIGKPNTTVHEVKNGRMAITSNGHEALGGKMVVEFLSSLGFNQELIIPISNLVANHLAGVNISKITSHSSQVKAVKRLSRKLHPATIQQLLFLMEADSRGRLPQKEPSGAKIIADIAKDLDVTVKQYEYILMGRHLIEWAGLRPSLEFGIILKASYEAQENGEINNLDDAKKWLLDYLNKSISEGLTRLGIKN